MVLTSCWMHNIDWFLILLSHNRSKVNYGQHFLNFITSLLFNFWRAFQYFTHDKWNSIFLSWLWSQMKPQWWPYSSQYLKMTIPFLCMNHHCFLSAAARKKKQTKPLSFKVGLGRVIRGVSYSYVFCSVHPNFCWFFNMTPVNLCFHSGMRGF